MRKFWVISFSSYTVILIGVTTWRMKVDIQVPDSTWPSVILANLGLALNAIFFSMMLVISFLPKHLRSLTSAQLAKE